MKAWPDELVHDRLRHVGRNRKPDADVAASRRKDLRINPDQLSAGVDQSAAGIALVNGRVGLQKVLKAAIASAGRAALGADDAGGDRFADSERVADRETNVAHPHLVGIGKPQHRQAIGVELALDLRNIDDIGLAFESHWHDGREGGTHSQPALHINVSTQ